MRYSPRAFRMKQLFDKEKFYHELKKNLEPFFPAFEKVYVFGSFVKGTSKIDSDVDLLIVVNDEHVKDRHLLRQKILDALFPVFFPLDLILLSRSEFELNKVSGTVKDVIKSGVLVWKKEKK